jgi:hypothetical protein
LWPAVLLASPALFVLLGLFLNAVLYETGLWRSGGLEGFLTVAVFGGGLLSLVTTPALCFYAIGIHRSMPPADRTVVYALLGLTALAMIVVVRYLAGISDLS